jgi:esterase/lipase superfamily enzyme
LAIGVSMRSSRCRERSAIFSGRQRRTDVLIYVHGFKQTFETAALDAAHLADGIKFRGQTMVFSWPSKAGLFDYAYDRESAMWSRDEFERVLNPLPRAPGDRPLSHRRAQHGHHADARKPAPALCAIR